MSDVLARVQLVQLQIGRIQQRADKAVERNDVEAVEACRREMEVLLESMRQIREEQLLAQIDRNKSKPKRRWWRWSS